MSLNKIYRLTFSRVIKKKKTGGFSCVPYVLALFNCCLYTWYGLPVVSYRWENFPLVTINGIGILLEISFILIHFWFSSAKGKKEVAKMVVPIILICLAIGIISAFVFHDHRRRKVFVGSVGLVASVAMYASPLVVVRQVIKTKSVEFMPFYLSFFSFLASGLWMAYGLLSHDLFLASPNLVGTPLCILQLILYCKYRKNPINELAPQKWLDLEFNNEKLNQEFQLDEKKEPVLVVTENINTKI
ncbi:bidirectional sugar transporter SWEET3 isoform X2 [Lycium barbarum]|uniref:bidirectional sugar transporter SWEET3 isoform X2 n=1 Tax=Lycium barbarum TaxID=112863 RepID=UPI00293F07B4|nr:bidirectional sugar transporter SWEET3 isoform X2 [Lycium barbarum]